MPAYWSAAATGTGGAAVSARLEGRRGLLRARRRPAHRYLVTLTAPERLPAAAVVRVVTPAGTRTADATVPAEVLPAAAGGRRPEVLVARSSSGPSCCCSRRRGRPARSRARPGERATPRAGRRGRAARVERPDRADPVVDREPLTAIGKALRAGRPAVVRAADGRAGLGVTTAMIEFAHRNRDAYDIVWWIAAQDPQLVGDQMAHLAEVLDLAAPADSAEQAMAAVLAALGKHNRWLLVFDDAGARRDLARFLPAGPGHLLVGSDAGGTSPQHQWRCSRSRTPSLSAAAGPGSV